MKLTQNAGASKGLTSISVWVKGAAGKPASSQRYFQVFTTPAGRTIDVAGVLCQGKGCTVVVSPGMRGLLLERLEKHIFPMDDVTATDFTQQTKCAAPAHRDAVQHQACDMFSSGRRLSVWLLRPGPCTPGAPPAGCSHCWVRLWRKS